MVTDAEKVELLIYRVQEARQLLDKNKEIAWASAHHALDKALVPFGEAFYRHDSVDKDKMKDIEKRMLEDAGLIDAHDPRYHGA